MMLQRVGEQRLAGLVLTAVALAAVGLGSSYGLGTWQRPGPGCMPVVVGLLLAFLSLTWVLVEPKVEKAGREDSPPRGALVRVALAMLMGPLLLPLLGYLLTAFLVCLVLMWAMGSKSWLLMLLVSVLVSAGCYALFVLWLNVPLPSGWLG